MIATIKTIVAKFECERQCIDRENVAKCDCIQPTLSTNVTRSGMNAKNTGTQLTSERLRITLRRDSGTSVDWLTIGFRIHVNAMMQERCCNVRLLGGLAMVALAGRVYNHIKKKSRFRFIMYFQYEEQLLTYISFINCKVTTTLAHPPFCLSSVHQLTSYMVSNALQPNSRGMRMMT